MSRISQVEEEILPGKYKVLYDFNAEQENQITCLENDVLEVKRQFPEKGWVWAQHNKAAAKKQGYVPKDYIDKIPEGDYDMWAYGSEIVACFYSFFSGLFILLYGSADVDSAAEIGLGACGMILASVLMLMVFFRDKVNAEYRAGFLILISIPLFAGYPWGMWGGIVMLLAACVELVKYSYQDEEFTPTNIDLKDVCTSMWGASWFSIVVFLFWLAANFGVFLLGLEYGYRRADDWSDSDQQYEIPNGTWAFTQAMASCICFQVIVMMIFALQGFQQILLSFTDFQTARVGKWAKFKQSLKDFLSKEAMVRFHRWIAYSMIACIFFHVFGAFATYNESGPGKDFDDIFGNAPTITGNILLVLLAVILSSAFISKLRSPILFRWVHRTGVGFIVIMIFHGKNFWAPNLWKYLVVPGFLFAMDFMFRVGVFTFRVKDVQNFDEEADNQPLSRGPPKAPVQ